MRRPSSFLNTPTKIFDLLWSLEVKCDREWNENMYEFINNNAGKISMKIINNIRAKIIHKDASNMGLGVFNCRKNKIDYLTISNEN